MGKQKVKHWAHLVLNRARGHAVVLRRMIPVNEMKPAQRQAHDFMANTETLRRREVREARRTAASKASGVFDAPRPVAVLAKPDLSKRAHVSYLKQIERESTVTGRKGLLNKVANYGRRLFNRKAS